jgi:putative oxidoreductase
MKWIIATNPENWAALVARLALGITIFPHGAQKVLGWFGGGGISGTMNFLTVTMALPFLIAVLVIVIEFLGSLFLIFGFLTRVAAFCFICHFIGVILISHFQDRFFMNWGGTRTGEGLEYFILLFGLAMSLLITGGGKASIDTLIKGK